MYLPTKVLLKRRKEGGAGPPSALSNGEIAFNEVDQVLYYGSGDDGEGNALTIIPIAGEFTSILKDSELYSPPSPLVQSDDYLIVTINGNQKAIRLFDL